MKKDPRKEDMLPAVMKLHDQITELEWRVDRNTDWLNEALYKVSDIVEENKRLRKCISKTRDFLEQYLTDKQIYEGEVE